jgi:hypothetical protein
MALAMVLALAPTMATAMANENTLQPRSGMEGEADEEKAKGKEVIL